jgi:hypothetical protein
MVRSVNAGMGIPFVTDKLRLMDCFKQGTEWVLAWYYVVLL